MSKYIYQKFLLNCDYESIKISDIPIFDGKIEEILDFRHEYCLFDIGKKIIRKIDVADIDEQIDLEEDWEKLLKALSKIDVIVLYNYQVNSENPIIKNYREATVKAYLYRLLKLKAKLYIV